MAVSKRLRFEIFRRDNHTCQSCGATAPDTRLEPDHVVPVALGGTDKPSNLRTLCEDCNAGKSATPPDAATVEQVSADAMRWSRAMQAAAAGMLADLRARESNREFFKQCWHRWHWGAADEPTFAPLPAVWEKSVDQILAAGLPVEMLKDCVDTAFAYEKVKPENKFKYACGVAWRKIDKLHEAARDALETGQQVPHGDETSVRDAMVEDLLEIFSASDLESLEVHEIDLAEVKQGIPIDEDDDRDPVVNVVELIYWDYQLDRDFMHDDVMGLLLELPGGVGEQAMKIVRFQLYDGEVPSEGRGRFFRLTMREAVDLFKIKDALASLGELPEDERSEWMEFTRALFKLGERRQRDTDPSFHIIQAAKVAQVIKGGRYYPAMCEGPGECIPYCSTRKAFHVVFDGCRGCDEDLHPKDTGHGYCEAHLEGLVDRGLRISEELVLTVRDFAAVQAPQKEDPPF